MRTACVGGVTAEHKSLSFFVGVSGGKRFWISSYHLQSLPRPPRPARDTHSPRHNNSTESSHSARTHSLRRTQGMAVVMWRLAACPSQLPPPPFHQRTWLALLGPWSRRGCRPVRSWVQRSIRHAWACHSLHKRGCTGEEGAEESAGA